MTNDSDALDNIDRKIIKILQDNSRTSVADIAREIGEFTENAIRYRIDKLDSEGFISSYTIELDPKKFGKNIIAIFNLNILPVNIEDSLKYLKNINDLTEIYLTTGNYSIIAIGYFENNSAITQFITENLKNIKMIDYDVITVLKRVKHELYYI